MTQVTEMPRWYVEDEDAIAFRQFFDTVRKTINPKDPFEDIWVEDLVHHNWEIRRLRLIKESLIECSLYRGLERILKPIAGLIEASKISEGWQAKRPDDIEEVRLLFEESGLDMGMVRAETVALRINEIEKIEHRIASAEHRRDRALRDIECHRFGFGERLKAEANKLIEGTVGSGDVILLENNTYDQ